MRWIALLATLHRPTGADWWRVATLSGLAEGMQRSSRRQAVLSSAAQATLSEFARRFPKGRVGHAGCDREIVSIRPPRLRIEIQRSATVARNEKSSSGSSRLTPCVCWGWIDRTARLHCSTSYWCRNSLLRSSRRRRIRLLAHGAATAPLESSRQVERAACFGW